MIRPELRPYQQDAIGWLRYGVKQGFHRQVLVAPTGAGKSVIAHEIVAAAADRGSRIVFVVNRVQLVQQFSERLRKAGIEHGILRGDESRMTWHPVLVASIQTVARRGLVVPGDVIVIDEGHGVPGSKDYLSFLREHKDAIVLGLTATPWAKGMAKVDPELGGPIFENVVVAATYSQLLAEGHLVDCDVYAPSVPDLTGVKTKRDQYGGIDYVENDLSKRVNTSQLVGDIVKHWKALANNTPTVCFACDIAHSKHIVATFIEAGVKAEHIDAYSEHEERKAILERVDRGETTVVSCAALLAEGWDQPSIRTMILARPTRSLIRYVQMAGRVLRPYPGKDKAVILDHSGTALRLGFPTDDRDYTLDDGKPRENKPGDDDKKPKEIKPCPACGYLDPLGRSRCPACGHKWTSQPKEREVADGKLALVKRAAVTMDQKQQFYSELRTIAGERNRSDGWVANTYRKKFGVWPRGLVDSKREPTPETRGYVKHLDIAFAKSKQRRAA